VCRTPHRATCTRVPCFRAEAYTENEAAAAIRSMVLVIEIGDTVFPDWYGVSSYLGSSLDNGGGAALVHGDPILDWRDRDPQAPTSTPTSTTPGSNPVRVWQLWDTP
jgi:hypothetical protein